jgi:hypothetical protein
MKPFNFEETGGCVSDPAGIRVKFFISNRFDGLGGRLVNLMVSMTLSQWLESRLLVHWPNGPDLAATSLEYLFSDPMMTYYRPTGPGSRIRWEMLACMAEIRSIRLVGNDDVLAAGDTVNYDAIAFRSVNLKAVADVRKMTVMGLREECAMEFARLKLQPAVLKRVSGYRYADRLADAIGVHVRRGDLTLHHKSVHRSRAVDERAYDTILDTHPKQDIFLATDDRQMVSRFRHRYGRRVLSLCDSVLIHPGFSRLSRRAIQFAFAEILLLSRCRKIVSGPSNFSRAAALIGNRPYILLEPDGNTDKWEQIRENWQL